MAGPSFSFGASSAAGPIGCVLFVELGHRRYSRNRRRYARNLSRDAGFLPGRDALGEGLSADTAKVFCMADWTDEECQRLIRFVSTGASVARAAAALGRNMKSVRRQARKLGRPFPTFSVDKRHRQAKLEAAAKRSR
jgi:hypothetical protein